MIEIVKNLASSLEEMFLSQNTGDQSDERQILRLDECSHAFICKLWDGIFLWGNDVHSHHIAYHDYTLNQKDYAVLNICHAGRCEVEMRDDTYIYMTPGLLNINSRTPKDGYSYPGGAYEGIEVAFDLEMLKEKTPVELSAFGLTYETLEEYLTRGNGNYMAAISDSIFMTI